VRWDSGAHLLLHLGMSGKLLWVEPERPWDRHTHLVVDFGDRELRLSDPRRFGRIGWRMPGEALKADLGVDPLSRRFQAQWLAAQLQTRRAPIKSVLLDQRIVAGLGNIYADESLFHARIHPQRPAGGLSADECGRLVRAIKAVLRTAIKHRGTSFSDYVDALGHPGQNQAYLQVYARQGQPCGRCRTPIVRVWVQNRSSYFCPRCQRHKTPADGEEEWTPRATV
jgi:formamidopyrimidine-DNA glycosylase